MTISPPVEQVYKLPEIQNLPLGSRHCFSLRVTSLADGTTLSLPVNIIVGKNAGLQLLMVAGVHGNEYEGILAQLELWEELSPEDINGTIVMVPVANPLAFRACQRRNPEDMIDMNRTFPGKADGTVTERLAYCLYHDIARNADRILSMHGWTNGSLVVPYVEYPRNSPVSEFSEAMARAFGLEYIEAFDWPSGLLVQVCTQAGIPAIETEIGGLSASFPENRGLYKFCARNLMRHLNILDGNPEIPKVVHPVIRSMLIAETGGILRQHKELREWVKRGETIATICDLNSTELSTCEAPRDGFIAAQLLGASVNPGDLIAVLFTPKDEI